MQVACRGFRKVALVAGSIALLGAVQPVNAAETAATPAAFWKIASPQELPFEEQVVSQREENGISYKEFYFTSELTDGEKYRIFAAYAAPKTKAKVAAILYIHGADGTADRAMAQAWAQRGYACLSFDWTGKPFDEPLPYEHYSRFSTKTRPPEKARAYDAVGQFMPQPKESRTYHSLIAARRALSWLRAQREVNAGKLGVFGVSWGSFYSLLLGGIDSRVKASVIVYGSGFFQSTGLAGGTFGLTGPLSYSAPEARQAWLQSFDPEHYIAQNKAPCFMMTGTKDIFFWLPLQQRTYAALPGEKRQWLEANNNHTIHTDLKGQMNASAARWFDYHLRGQGGPLPRVGDVTVAGRSASFVLSPQAEATNVQINYLLTPYDPGGENISIYPAGTTHWETVAAERDEARKAWHATLPEAAAENQWISVYASMQGKDGLILSSPVTVAPYPKVNRP